MMEEASCRLGLDVLVLMGKLIGFLGIHVWKMTKLIGYIGSSTWGYYPIEC